MLKKPIWSATETTLFYYSEAQQGKSASQNIWTLNNHLSNLCILSNKAIVPEKIQYQLGPTSILEARVVFLPSEDPTKGIFKKTIKYFVS